MQHAPTPPRGMSSSSDLNVHARVRLSEVLRQYAPVLSAAGLSSRQGFFRASISSCSAARAARAPYSDAISTPRRECGCGLLSAAQCEAFCHPSLQPLPSLLSVEASEKHAPRSARDRRFRSSPQFVATPRATAGDTSAAEDTLSASRLFVGDLFSDNYRLIIPVY